MTTRLHLLIKGRVQGVGFRWFACDTARRLGLKGWVRNLPGGEVEAEVEGESALLEEFIGELKTGLPHARVGGVERREISLKREKELFEIH